MINPFVAHRKIRFAHCDPAGIAYYPRCLELCDGAVEDWCEAVLVPRRILHLEMGLALPSVDLNASFRLPCRLGERLDIGLEVHCIGRTSIQLSTAVTSAGEPRFAVHYTQVLMRMADARPVVWPDEWRARLSSLLPPNTVGPAS
ncbi:MAG TPA: thioesterase family protein [Sphingomicrobium sp.]|nr:thioesterase family protein [Sphingomicrobium sp.]